MRRAFPVIAVLFADLIRTMKPDRGLLRLVALIVLLIPSPACAEIFTDYSSFLSAGSFSVFTDSFDNYVLGSEHNELYFNAISYVPSLLVSQRDGHPIRIVAAGDGSYAQPQNFNSGNQGISSNASPGFPFGYDNSKSDNYDFQFGSPVVAAGLWVGNLNPGQDTITVSFLDSVGGVIDSLLLSTANPGLIDSAPEYNNRLFVGLSSSTLVERIRVFGPAGDFDGVVFDDVVTGYVVPEPSTLALFAFGFAGLMACGWRRYPVRPQAVRLASSTFKVAFFIDKRLLNFTGNSQ